MKNFCILVSLLAFVSCAPQSFQVLSDDYSSSAKSYNTSITILPLTEDLVDEKVLESYLKRKGAKPSVISARNKNIFKSYFGLVFSETATGDVHDLIGSDNLSFLNDVSFTDSTLSTDSKVELPVIIPQKGKLFDPNSPTDFTLLAQNISWEIEFVEEQSKPVGGSNNQRFEFSMNMKYVIWDNTKEVVAGFGNLKEKRNLTKIPERNYYLDFFEDLSRKIIRKSPIQERYK
ncbi:MAG: hypothetical protein JJ892_13785 [Balneola sp.]|nr:hypothetical protein [Balneola sp.]MBO6652006.1 hypothetical protein [Balneola sp.]MBO6712680.1 hypothetical protein [Balneola sp.]MBO6801342.1 hypothetical protein [Balneola sp.]MBO6870499.1 hypothetical protein [Balneola sp.]